MTEQCGRVEPRWIRLGTVKWDGSNTREPLFTIEYIRCPSVGYYENKNGDDVYLCSSHATCRILVSSISDTRDIVNEVIREAPFATLEDQMKLAMKKCKGSCNPAIVRSMLAGAI